MKTLCEAHAGDSPEVMLNIIKERSELRGWSHWAGLLREQLDIDEKNTGSLKLMSKDNSNNRRTGPRSERKSHLDRRLKSSSSSSYDDRRGTSQLRR